MTSIVIYLAFQIRGKIVAEPEEAVPEAKRRDDGTCVNKLRSQSIPAYSFAIDCRETLRKTRCSPSWIHKKRRGCLKRRRPRRVGQTPLLGRLLFRHPDLFLCIRDGEHWIFRDVSLQSIAKKYAGIDWFRSFLTHVPSSSLLSPGTAPSGSTTLFPRVWNAR